MGSIGSWMDATIAVGGSKSSGIDLGDKYETLELLIPEMGKCKLSLEVAENGNSTYYKLGEGVTTDEETFNRAATWLLGGFQWVKLVRTGGDSAAVTIRIRGRR